MFIVWLEVNHIEIKFKTAAANRNQAVREARQAHPDGRVTSVLPA